MDGVMGRTEPAEVLRDFVGAVRALWQEPLSDADRWQRIGSLAPMLLQSPELRQKARSWPANANGGGRACNLLFYEDPDYGFVVNGLIKNPKAGTPVHDHAHTWTVYGVISGQERIVRYQRIDDGADATHTTLEKTDDYVCAAGFVDVVPPGIIHAEFAGDERTVAVIIRSERIGDFPQGMFDVETGAVMSAPGPEQVPYAL